MKIPEFEYYHGMVLRRLIVESGVPLTVVPFDFSGRVDSFMVDGRVIVYLKHSTARLAPWPFTFNSDALRELIELRKRIDDVFIVLVCGDEGIISLSLKEFISISVMPPGGAVPIRISRNRNEMFVISGNAGKLDQRKSSGLVPVFRALNYDQIAK